MRQWLGGHLAEILALQHRVHTHLELSLEETATAALVAEMLTAAGHDVHMAALFGTARVLGAVREP